MARITEAQLQALSRAAFRRTTAGNDDGWVSLFDCRRPTVRALVRGGYLEARLKGPTTSGGQLYRVTDAGRRALAASEPEGH